MRSNNQRLHRILNVDHFMEMIRNKELHFVRPQVWQDEYEGLVFQLIKTPAGSRHVLDLIKSIPGKQMIGDLFYSLALKFEKRFFCQSWTYSPISKKMWEDYSHEGQAVGFEINQSDVNLLDRVTTMNIKYHFNEYININNELGRILSAENQIDWQEAFRVKRKRYEHEKEVRLVYDKHELSLENGGNLDPNLEMILDQCFEPGVHRHPNYIKINYSKISNFIKVAYPHPKMNTKDKISLKDFCRRNGIKFQT